MYKSSFLAMTIISTFSLYSCEATPEKFTLMTVLYNEKNEARIAEYITCLEKNMANDRIDQIHVIYDSSKDTGKTTILDYLKEKNIPITCVKGRPTYALCFALANYQYPNKRIILANADIFFNETLHLLDDYDLTDTFLALTRWNITKSGALQLFKQYKPCGHFSKTGSESSQDVWIFSTPIRDFRKNSVKLGLMGCDTTIAYYARESGLRVLNPCLSIQCCHLHLSKIRNYNPASAPYAKDPKLPVPWVTLTEQ
jgi:hypothetical protein